MKIFLRVVLSLMLGIVVGSAVNMALIILGSYLVKVPETFNPMNAEDWTVTLIIFPFLAHSIGTLAGSFTAAKVSKNYHMAISSGIGLWFLAGGIYMTTIIPAPAWFEISDLVICYIPMAWLGWNLSNTQKLT